MLSDRELMILLATAASPDDANHATPTPPGPPEGCADDHSSPAQLRIMSGAVELTLMGLGLIISQVGKTKVEDWTQADLPNLLKILGVGLRKLTKSQVNALIARHETTEHGNLAFGSEGLTKLYWGLFDDKGGNNENEILKAYQKLNFLPTCLQMIEHLSSVSVESSSAVLRAYLCVKDKIRARKDQFFLSERDDILGFSWADRVPDYNQNDTAIKELVGPETEVLLPVHDA